MAYVGVEDRPIGVKVTIYDPLRCEEKGLFITLLGESFKKTQKELDQQSVLMNGAKKRTRKYRDEYFINSHYHF